MDRNLGASKVKTNNIRELHIEHNELGVLSRISLGVVWGNDF